MDHSEPTGRTSQVTGRYPGPDERDALPGMDGPTLRTRSVHAGLIGGPVHPVVPPIVPGTAYAYDDAGLAGAFALTGQPMYARDGMPNALALEGAVAELEGAQDAVAVASGMAAISLALLGLLSAGDHVVICCTYQDTVSLAHDHIARFGIEVTTLPDADPGAVAAAIGPRTRLILAETIANPAMTLTDIPALAAIAHGSGARLVIDNTFATPALCRPLAHGADLVLHSAGKFLGGHHDASGGVIAGDTAAIATLRRAAYLLGPMISPFDAWLILRGVRTLAPRLSWASASALRLAGALAAHPTVLAVRYPGCPPAGPDSSALRDRLLPDGAGALLAFDLDGGPDAAVEMTRHLRTIAYAGSVGGTGTIVSFPPLPPTRSSSENARDYRCATLRLSVGLEDPADLIADLGQALDRVSAGADRIGQTD